MNAIEQAWNAGYAAATEGKPVKTNPFFQAGMDLGDLDIKAAYAWFYGWRACPTCEHGICPAGQGTATDN